MELVILSTLAAVAILIAELREFVSSAGGIPTRAATATPRLATLDGSGRAALPAANDTTAVDLDRAA